MHHHTTLFSRTLSLIPRHVFQKLAQRHKSAGSSRKFGFKEQFTVMAFIQLAARHSLIPLQVPAVQSGHNYDQDLPVALSMDLFSQNRGGIKLHVLLDHDGHIRAFTTIPDARFHESRIARTLELPRGSIVLFDEGYVNHNRFQTLGARHISIVTRLKRNIVCKLLKRRPVDRRSGVTSDHIVEGASHVKPLRLRRIGYWDPESGRRSDFLTNHFRLSAKTIADNSKNR